MVWFGGGDGLLLARLPLVASFPPGLVYLFGGVDGAFLTCLPTGVRFLLGLER